jgi:hypothetical protein
MKANKTMRGQVVPNHRRNEKTRNQTVRLIELHTTKPLIEKLNDRNHHIPININTECQWT